MSKGAHEFVMLSSVIHANIGKLFPGMKVTGCHQFRLTRNSNLWVEEEEADDLLRALKSELPRRRFGAAVRLEVSDECTHRMADFLLNQFGLDPVDLLPSD
jgi:polyphosphate kinase